jgi:hypothetical protein
LTEASDADPFSHARTHEAFIADRVRMRTRSPTSASWVRARENESRSLGSVKAAA